MTTQRLDSFSYIKKDNGIENQSTFTDLKK